MVNTSDKIGTFFKTVFPSLAKTVAASKGKTAFFAPSMVTLPTKRLSPPWTTIFSIKYFPLLTILE